MPSKIAIALAEAIVKDLHPEAPPSLRDARMVVIGDEFESPFDIGQKSGIDNCGGTAASLRVLLRKGLVEQKRIGHKGRWELFGYRKKIEEREKANAE